MIDIRIFGPTDTYIDIDSINHLHNTLIIHHVSLNYYTWYNYDTLLGIVLRIVWLWFILFNTYDLHVKQWDPCIWSEMKWIVNDWFDSIQFPTNLILYNSKNKKQNSLKLNLINK